MSTEDDVALDFAALPLALSATGFAVSVTLEFVLPMRFLPAVLLPGWSIIVGPVLIALGLLLMIWAMRTLKQAGTGFNAADKTLALVTHGPFRLSRNPMYLTLLLFQAGVATTFSLEWGLILLPVVWLLLDRLVIAREERYLAALFGEAFADYRRAVRRWL